MPKKIPTNEILYHIGLSQDMILGAEYVLLPGDPYRVESLAKIFDQNAIHLNSHREYTSYLANFHNQKILVCSTGIGAPSTAIAIEELATIGLRYMLRVGTCGAIQPDIELGDVIITEGAVRLEGTSTHYAPIEYPAVASLEFTNDLINGAKNAQVPYHIGITATSDTFWPGQERYDNYSGYMLKRLRGSMDEWRALNVLNFEMEAATLLVLGKVFKLHAACICGVVAKRTESEKVSVATKDTVAKAHWEHAAKAGIYESLLRRKLIS